MVRFFLHVNFVILKDFSLIIWARKTSLTPPLVVEVPVPRQEIEVLYVCYLYLRELNPKIRIKIYWGHFTCKL